MYVYCVLCVCRAEGKCKNQSRLIWVCCNKKFSNKMCIWIVAASITKRTSEPMHTKDRLFYLSFALKFRNCTIVFCVAFFPFFLLLLLCCMSLTKRSDQNVLPIHFRSFHTPDSVMCSMHCALFFCTEMSISWSNMRDLVQMSYGIFISKPIPIQFWKEFNKCEYFQNKWASNEDQTNVQ